MDYSSIRSILLVTVSAEISAFFWKVIWEEYNIWGEGEDVFLSITT